MKLRTLILFAAAVFVLAACGSEGEDTTTTETDDVTTTEADSGQEATTTTEAEMTTTAADDTTTSAAEAADGVQVAESDLGEILVGPDGFTLYIFTPDVDGESTCYEGCAEAWPHVPADTPISSDLDDSMFGSVARTDGGEQLTVNGMPLYFFASDANPGDTNGQGVNDVWFVVDAQGGMIEASAGAAAGVQVAETDLGEILVDPDGFTLYIFTADTDGESTCYDGCAETWPPVPADTPISPDLDAAMFGSVARTDGGDQLTVNGMPLYLFTPDESPGDTNGQGVNDVWFVVDAQGGVIEAAAGATQQNTGGPPDYGYDY